MYNNYYNMYNNTKKMVTCLECTKFNSNDQNKGFVPIV